ncbi:MAG: hypothetical protein LBH85_08825 [Treponema sp.]|jgi:hypothetical protein|nr:hypothetical protein [Treponema sp.]
MKFLLMRLPNSTREYIVHAGFARIHTRVAAASGEAAEFPAHLWQACFQQEPVGFLNRASVFKPRGLNHPLPASAEAPLHPAFRLMAVGGYCFISQPVAPPSRAAH